MSFGSHFTSVGSQLVKMLKSLPLIGIGEYDRVRDHLIKPLTFLGAVTIPSAGGSAKVLNGVVDKLVPQNDSARQKAPE
ncbi:hypothetical protein EVAR_20271_1 [Eumeta japonica]|uniref:Uncharacterized protein n=1 Tax=Eumeta variegata TaxID=151549 RepID=A0A4C1VNM3_EUMVA|nr:hypothetical protein EVAR_20271_1 [Eumeta japonica]